MVKQTPEPPPWGRYLKERRSGQGRSIRQAALSAGISDSYWGQVERGYQESGGEVRDIKPSRRSLLDMADALRLSSKETNELLALADYPPTRSGDTAADVREVVVNLTGLSRTDVQLLNQVAERFRAARAASEAPDVPATALRKPGKAPTPAPSRIAARRAPSKGKGTSE